MNLKTGTIKQHFRIHTTVEVYQIGLYEILNGRDSFIFFGEIGYKGVPVGPFPERTFKYNSLTERYQAIGKARQTGQEYADVEGLEFNPVLRFPATGPVKDFWFHHGQWAYIPEINNWAIAQGLEPPPPQY